MSLGDVDITVGCGYHIIGLVEQGAAHTITGNAGLAECHQHFTSRTEFVYGVSLARSTWICRQLIGIGCTTVGNPDVAFGIYMNAVREYEYTATKAGNDFAVLVVFHDGINIGTCTAVGAATLGNPDRFAVRIDIYGAGRAPLAITGEIKIVRIGIVRIRVFIGWVDRELGL